MEYFYSFLSPLVFEYGGTKYFCWGYREVDDEVVSFSATLSEKENWTLATCYNNADLVHEFKNYLPEKIIKRRRKKK